jgi:hypothetical protein
MLGSFVLQDTQALGVARVWTATDPMELETASKLQEVHAKSMR